MPIPVRRSVVLLPAHRLQQVPQVATWRPDALCLDLDLVPLAQRAAARGGLRDALALVGRQGTEALVRVSAQEQRDDLRAAVWPGVSALVVPGIRQPRDVWQVESALSTLEKERGLEPGSVGLVAYLDHGHGLWYAREIVHAASPRLQAVVLGMGDLAFDALKEPESVPFFTGPVPRFPVPEYLWGRLALVAVDAGIALLGLLGTTIAPGHADKEKLLAAAQVARQMGFRGAFTLHREGVDACGQAFPGPTSAARRRRRAIAPKASPVARRRATA